MRKQSPATAPSPGRVLARTLAESQAFAEVTGALALPVEGGGAPVLTQVNGHLDWTNVGVDA